MAHVNLATSYSSSNSSRNVEVYSSCHGSSDILYVPVNSSNIFVYPEWHIHLYGAGSFRWEVKGTTVETGISLGSFSFDYNWTLSQGSYANATLTLASTTYSFHDILTGILNNQDIVHVSVTSSFKGQSQHLTVLPGVSGDLMYPQWTLTMISSENQSFSVILNGQIIFSGISQGIRVFNFNVSGNTASLTVGIGKHVYEFPNEIISSVPLTKYYSSKPPPLVATEGDILYSAGAGAAAFGIWMLIAAITERPWIMDRMKRRPKRR